MNNGESHIHILMIVCAENPDVDEGIIKDLLNEEIKGDGRTMSVEQKKLF